MVRNVPDNEQGNTDNDIKLKRGRKASYRRSLSLCLPPTTTMSYQPVQEDELDDELEAVSSIPEPNPTAYVRLLGSGTVPLTQTLPYPPFAFQKQNLDRYS
jgi:hypothetical protein